MSLSTSQELSVSSEAFAAVSSEAGSYAEEVVGKALVKAEFKIPPDGRDTRRFRGKEWKGQHDLDFIVHGEAENRYYGIQVKNTLTYPEWDDVAGLIDACEFLGLTPWFISRQMPGDYTWDIWVSGGFYTLFDKWLLPEKHKDLCREVTSVLGFPVLCTGEEVAIDFLVEKLEPVHAYKTYSK